MVGAKYRKTLFFFFCWANINRSIGRNGDKSCRIIWITIQIQFTNHYYLMLYYKLVEQTKFMKEIWFYLFIYFEFMMTPLNNQQYSIKSFNVFDSNFCCMSKHSFLGGRSPLMISFINPLKNKQLFLYYSKCLVYMCVCFKK